MIVLRGASGHDRVLKVTFVLGREQ